jgi:hypothetical protein
MFSTRAIGLIAVALLGAISARAAAPAVSPHGLEFFEKKIRPVLVAQCYKCHSSKSQKVKGGLLLDSREATLKGGDSGPALVPGQPKKSRLLTALSYTDHELQMPPKAQLPAAQIKDFETWIKMGAPDPRVGKAPPKKDIVKAAENFWSFQPLTNAPPPTVKNTNWIKTSIDRFILAKLEEKNLTPVASATRRTLIRRATFDLIGLPPTPEATDAFLKDKSPKAFARVIDRLLASPQYGERWGRHWLDVVRYADTSGCNSDFPVPTAYKYRNYVIKSFNEDKPYDQFVREQIAGDLLPSQTDEERFDQVIATGYLAISRRFGSRNNEFHLTIEDTIDNVGKGILGLSVSCARCHDHKFDPIPTSDYYSLYGIFSSTKYAFPGTEVYRHPKDFVPLAAGTNAEAVVERQTELAELDSEIEKLQEEKRLLARDEKKKGGKKNEPKEEPEVELTAEEKQKLIEIKAALEDARSRQKQLEARAPVVERAYAVSEANPVEAKIQVKGSPSDLGEVAPRGFLQILGGQKLPPEEKGSGRLELAQWLTSAKNPLTARVMVNRIWQHHFGAGIVQTPNDFGARGKAPTHPELLDYLGTQFMRNGWSIKKMHKLIMLSQVYQLSSSDDLRNAEVDANNSFFWKYNRQRLDAEEVRDAMLFVSGTLDATMGGEHPFPPENEWRYSQHRPFVAVYETNRRSVYLMQQRIKKQPFLEIFDGADPNATTGERPLSTTPIQALFMMNDPFAHEQADKFAVRLGLAHLKQAQRIDYAYQLAFGRPAAHEEIQMGQKYLKQCAGELKNTKIPADQQPRATLASYARVLFSSSEFLFID